MNKFIFTTILFVFLLFNKNTNAQCTVNAGQDQNFNCNATAQLFADVPAWVDKNSNITANILEIRFVGDTLIAVGTNAIYRSTNFGTSWTAISAYYNDNRSLEKNSNNVLFAAGYYSSSNNGRIMKSTDYGLNWTIVVDQGSREYNDLATKDDTVWAVGINRGTWTGRLDYSINAGSTWGQLSNYSTTAWTTPYAVAVNQTVLVVGTGGFSVGGFKYSLNRGATFNTVDTLINGNSFPTVNDIYFVTNTVGFAACDNDVILKTIDGGISWSEAFNGQNYNKLNAISFKDLNNGYAVGNGGTIYKTTDGGTTWANVSTGSTSFLSIAKHNFKPYILTSAFHILAEKTYQFSWNNAALLNANNIQNPVATLSQTTTFTVSITDENFCTSTDDVTIFVNPVDMEVANDQIILPGQSVQLFVDADTNSTQTVSFQWSPATNMINPTSTNPTVNPTQTTSYSVITTINGLACGSDTVEITVFSPSVNAGADKSIQYGGSVSFYDASFDAFMPKLTPLNNNTYGNNSTFGFIDFFSSQLGYVTNYSSHELYKTTDGEIYHSILEIADSISYMKFYNAQRGAVGTNTGQVYYTTDGGQNWIISQPLATYILDIEFTATDIYVFGYSGVIKSSTNGSSWSTINSGGSDPIYRASLVDANTIFVNSGNTVSGNYVKKTTNGGASWTTVASNVGFLEDIYFIDANNGFIAQYTGAKRTTDGGTTWTDIIVDGGMLPTTSHVRSIEFLNDTIGYMGSPFIKTIDGGATWTKINTNYSPEYDISVVSENTIFGAGYTHFVKYLAPQYTWTPATYLDNPNILKPVFTPGITTNYILEVEMFNVYSTTDTVLVTVPDPCISQVAYTVNTTNNSVNFTTLLNQPPYTSPFVYNWQFGDGTQSTSANPYHVFPSAGYQNVHFTAASFNGCTIDTTFVVEIGSAASIDCQANFAYSVDHATKSITVNNFSLGNNITDYVYYFDDGNYAHTPSATHQYSDAGNYNVCLTIYSASTGCSNTKCKQFVVDTAGYACQAHFVYTVDSATKTATFYNTSKNNTSNHWMFGDNSVSTLENPTHTYGADNHYITTLKVENGTCKDYFQEVVNINVANASLYSGFGYIYNSTFNKTNGYPVKFYGVSAGTPAKYLWDFGDGSLDSLTNQPMHEFAAPGNYNVCLTVSDPVAGLTYNVCKSIIITGINNYEETAGFDIFPNPAKNQLVVELENAGSEEFTVSVVNSFGQIVLVENLAGNKISLDISKIEAGTYFVRVQNEKQTSTRKLLILR